MNTELFIDDFKKMQEGCHADELPGKVAEYVKAMPLMPQHWDNRKARPQKIIALCSQHFGMTLEGLCDKSRIGSIRYPRQVVQYLLCKRATMKHSDIAKIFGQNRTTIIHTRKKIQDLIDTDEVIRAEIWQLNSQI